MEIALGFLTAHRCGAGQAPGAAGPAIGVSTALRFRRDARGRAVRKSLDCCLGLQQTRPEAGHRSYYDALERAVLVYCWSL